VAALFLAKNDEDAAVFDAGGSGRTRPTCQLLDAEAIDRVIEIDGAATVFLDRRNGNP
jgi:hypothetical protein